MTEKQKQAFLRCGIPPEEWEEIIATDKEIDRGAKLFELPDELKAGAKKARQADRKPTTERKPRERKENSDKRILLEQLTLGLNQCPTNINDFEIINPEREFLFTYNGIRYKVVLSAPRK